MKTDKYLILDVVLMFVIMVAILLLFYDVTSHKDEKSLCVQNPLNYGAERLTKINNAEFSCTCTLNISNSPIIYFDRKNFTVERPYNKDAISIDINFSKLID